MHAEKSDLPVRFDGPSEAAVLAEEEAGRTPRTRRAFRWSATSVPVAPLLLIGMALGPSGLGLLSSRVLSVLDAAVPVALAVLGVLVGLGLNPNRLADRRLMTAGAIEAVTTASVIAAGLGIVAIAVPGVIAEPVWAFAVVAGVCGASSLAVPSIRGGDLAPAQRLLELDVLVPIVGGGLALAFLREGSALGAVSLAAQACAVVLVVAVAAWLLLDRNPGQPEGRVFTIATLLLVGGVTDYLSFSALVAGLLAGVFWRRMGGGVRDGIERDALHVRHPLVVLVLLAAGARVELTEPALALGAIYAVLRIAGKLAGGAIASWSGEAGLPRGVGLRLLPPGTFGIAFAMNALRAGGAELSALLTIAVVGTVLAEMVAALAGSSEEGQ
jgi:hypothetical protein